MPNLAESGGLLKLAWAGQPGGTRECALICDDPDTPTTDPWVHRVVYTMPANVVSLPEETPGKPRLATPVQMLQGKYSWTSDRTIGYRGPAPPRGHGVQHYCFEVYALDGDFGLEVGLDKQQLLDTMQEHIFASGELVGAYQR